MKRKDIDLEESESMIPCPRCHGMGAIPNPRFWGQYFRGLRKKRDISLRGMADRLGITAGYLSDLELGRRGWNEDLINVFEDFLEKGI